MRSFLLSTAALLLLVSAVAANSAFVCKRLGEIEACARLLPEQDPAEEGAKETVQRLYSLWDRTVEPLSYTVGYQLIDRADDAIEEIVAAAETENGGSFSTARRRFIDAVCRMRKLQGLTLTGVF